MISCKNMVHESGGQNEVLVMNCSPVRNGATAEIVNIVTARLEKKHDVKTNMY